MTKGILKSSKTLDKLHKAKLNRAPTNESHAKYKQFRNTYNQTKRTAKDMHYSNLFEEYKNDSKNLWPMLGRAGSKKDICQELIINNSHVMN